MESRLCWLSASGIEGLKVLYNMESKLCGSFHYQGCIVFEFSNFVKDVFQGFNVE